MFLTSSIQTVWRETIEYDYNTSCDNGERTWPVFDEYWEMFLTSSVQTVWRETIEYD